MVIPEKPDASSGVDGRQTTAAVPVALSAESSCEARCLGYSISNRLWVCSLSERAYGMVAHPGGRCAMQFLRNESVVAEVALLSEKYTGAQLPDATLSVDDALSLVPVDLLPSTRFELVEGREHEIPGSTHRIKWSREKQSDGSAKRSQIQVLCNPSSPRSSPLSTSSHSRERARVSPMPRYPRDPIVFRGADQCDLSERYAVEVASGNVAFAIVEDISWGCIDYSVSTKRAHPIDLARVCLSAPDSK